MPRHLLLLHHLEAGASRAGSLGAAAASLLLCAFALLACASHGGRWLRRLAAVGRGRHSEPVICMHQVQPGVEAEGCIWQKSILMGGKCELPDFSGVVAYDSAGNLIAPGRPQVTLALE